MPVRPLHANATLESVKDDARRLIREHKRGEPQVLQRLREFVTRFLGADDAKIAASEIKWAEALLSVAREYGFKSWPALKAHVEQRSPSPEVPLQERIGSDQLRRAVELVDAGDVDGLAAYLAANSKVARERAHFAGMNYFRNPSLLEFIAENPVRNGRLPVNIAAVAKVILDAGAADNQAALDETLALVASGRVARESGHQESLIRLLCSRGAKPANALQSALGHCELKAAELLIQLGAPLSLSASAAFGRIDEARRSLPSADAAERHLALAYAAQFGHPAIVELLLDAGEDPNRYNPQGAHSHSMPLHQAAWHGRDDVARLLIGHGARKDVRDTIYRGTPADWAEYNGHERLAELLRA